MNVFEHICKKDGNSFSLFVPEESNCKQEIIEKKATCCKEKNKIEHQKTQVFEENCCSDKINTFKLSFDYNQHYQVDFVSVLVKWIDIKSLIIHSKNIEVYTQEINTKYFNKPPPLYSNPIYIHLETYLI